MDTVSFLNNYSGIFVRFSGIMLAQSGILILILLILDLLLRRKVRAVFRYCLWMLLLAKLVLPVGLSLPYTPAYWAGNLLPETNILPQTHLPPVTNINVIENPQPVNDQPDLTVANPAASESVPYKPVETPAATAKSGRSFTGWWLSITLTLMSGGRSACGRIFVSGSKLPAQ
jgi:hypothetical protein